MHIRTHGQTDLTVKIVILIEQSSMDEEVALSQCESAQLLLGAYIFSFRLIKSRQHG